MIASLFGKYQEIVGLVSVYNLESTILKKYVIEHMNFLREIGLTVVAITSDNASKNRSTFKSIRRKNKMLQPDTKEWDLYTYNYSNNQIIHCFFDAPHIYKTIRNNWVNLKNPFRLFEYPQNDIFNGVHASFNTIVDLYHKEKIKTIKLAHNGSSYHMTLKEGINAEKKLRIRTTIKLGNTNFDLSQLNSEIINETAKGDLFINLDTYLENLEEFLNSLTNSSTDYLGGALYVTGYIAYKIKQEINRKECIGLFIQDDCDLKNENLVKHPNLNDFKFDIE